MSGEKFRDHVALLRMPRWAEKYITVMAMQSSTTNDNACSAIILAGVEKAYEELGMPLDCKVEDLWKAMRNATENL